MAEVLISQGAEGRIYASTHLGQPCIVKERFKKEYRHPVLDERLTKERLGLEARNLVRARKAGVLAPLPYLVDVPTSRIVMERIHGVTVKQWLLSSPSAPSWTAVGVAVGASIARLHACGLVHGDLTTSNLMLQGVPTHATPSPHAGSAGYASMAAAGMAPLPLECTQQSDAAFAAAALLPPGPTEGGGAAPPHHHLLPYPLVFIDFGLSSTNASVEDKGVDLYVLERAVGSTHSGVAEPFFAAVLEGYASASQPRTAGQGAGHGTHAVLAKFQQVRMRGRKRLAFG